MNAGYEELDREGLLAAVELLDLRLQALVAQSEQLRQENERLSEANKELQQLVQELAGQKKDPPSWVKPNRPPRERGEGKRRKRAPEHNHGRPRELVITHTLDHALDHCPDCGYRLVGESLDYTRQVIELPEPVKVEVVEHRVIKRYCPHCGRYRSPRLNLQGIVMGQGRLGVRLVSLIAYLRQSLRLPLRQIGRYLSTLHQLELSEGGIVEILHGVRKAVQPLAEGLREQGRGSPVQHADETGWREEGKNGYLWVLSTEGPRAVRYYRFDQSRGTGAAKELVGDRVRGYLVTDLLGSYNGIAGGHQRCWPHLLRALHKLKEKRGQHPEVGPWAERVAGLYYEGKAWLETEAARERGARERKFGELTGRLRLLALPQAQVKGHPCWGLAKLMLRYEAELFPFVLVEGLPADNNLAERSLRPMVVIRKISGGTRSSPGTSTRMALATVMETWQARGLNPFVECLKLLSSPAAPPA